MQYPKKVMKLTELVKEMGFPEEYLQRAYRLPTQRFAGKMNPMKKNSPIIFDTEEFEKWRLHQIETESRTMIRHGTVLCGSTGNQA